MQNFAPHLSALLSIITAAAVTAAGVPMNSVEFVDCTRASGINFVHHTGGTGKKYLPETLGSGCAFIDLDGDGWADVLLLNGSDFGGGSHRVTSTLYLNNRNGTF